MKNIKFVINGEKKSLVVDPKMKLLWFIRDILGLTGTKYSCGKSLCGTCMVHIDGKAVKSCSTTVGKIIGKTITTIEGLSKNANHPLQSAWVEEEVSQCGYCQPGQIMKAAELLNNNLALQTVFGILKRFSNFFITNMCNPGFLFTKYNLVL